MKPVTNGERTSSCNTLVSYVTVTLMVLPAQVKLLITLPISISLFIPALAMVWRSCLTSTRTLIDSLIHDWDDECCICASLKCMMNCNCKLNHMKIFDSLPIILYMQEVLCLYAYHCYFLVYWFTTVCMCAEEYVD